MKIIFNLLNFSEIKSHLFIRQKSTGGLKEIEGIEEIEEIEGIETGFTGKIP